MDTLSRLICALLLVVSLVGPVGATTCWFYQFNGGAQGYANGQAAADGLAAYYNDVVNAGLSFPYCPAAHSNAQPGDACPVGIGSEVPGACTEQPAAGTSCSVYVHYNPGDGDVTVLSNTAYAYSGTCNTCNNLPNQDLVAVYAAGGAAISGSNTICFNGCTYYNSATSMSISANGTTSGPVIYGQAVSTGASCTASSPATSNVIAGNCVTGSGGGTACHEPSANVATVNSDVVNPAAPPAAGTCTGYSDGAVACNASAITTPPAPGASSVVDTPAAVVANGSNTVDWFSPGQVAASGNPVVATGGSQGGSSLGGGSSASGNSNCSLSGGTVVCSDGGGCASTSDGISCTGDSAYGGLDCTSPPVCTASDAACNVDFQAWSARCPGDTASGVAAVIAGDGDPVPYTASGLAAATASTIAVSGLSTSGPFDSVGTTLSSCPTGLWSFTWYGNTVSLDGLVYWLCQFAQAMRVVVLAVSGAIGLRILLSSLLGSGENITQTAPASF